MGLTILIASCNGDKQVKSDTNIEIKTVNKELVAETVVLEMEYFGWMCSCAQWITRENKTIFEEKSKRKEAYGDSLFYYTIPAVDSVSFPKNRTVEK